MALSDRFGLGGKVAIVTGGASGIGKGIARVLGEAGATVVIADRDMAGAATAVADLTAEGLAVEAVPLDLIDEASVIACCADIVARHGAPWVLVNNAASQDRELFLEATAAEWDRTFAINARGPFLMAREVARAMVDAGRGGRIVNIASNSVWAPQILGLGAYAASKGALYTFSQTIAFELLPHAITVNTVLPGGVITPGAINAKGPKGEGPASSRRPPFGFCEPEDIGGAVLYLASPVAARVTNQAIMVDAGFSLT